MISIMRCSRVLSRWRMSAACLVAGLSVWVVATLLITAVAWRSIGPYHPVIAYFIYSAARVFIPCIAIGIPATASALWLRSRRSGRQAVAGGLAVAAIGFATLAVAFGAGTAAVSGMAPMLLILAAELWLAFKLRVSRFGPRTA